MYQFHRTYVYNFITKMQNVLFLMIWIILFIICTHTLKINEENFMSYKDVSQQKSFYEGQNYDNTLPEGRGLHKIRKIKKKLFLICLLNNNGGTRRRYTRYGSPPEGRIFFPIVQQNTNVNVDGLSEDGQDDIDASDSGSTLLGNVNCDRILNSVGDIGHPLLGGLGNIASILGGGGNQQELIDNENDNRRFHRNVNKQIVRPIYKSIKRIHRYFK